MLPTFVIGLREGLEAALIVSIIATFLKRNQQSLRGMWIGVGAGVLLSLAVGLGLKLLSSALPQRQQEMLETVIGAVAIVFVTAMIVWMRQHSASLKSELESAAAAALKEGTTTALAVMAFLAVVREGFETSVFLLATIESAGSAPAAVAGAALGIGVALVLGYGIYMGGLRLDLRRFFTVTGVFLVFVAAGLVMSSLRTGHEAGWILVGQATTVDLSWLVPPGSIRSALFSGVFGIQTQPRVIEWFGWSAFLIPMLALTLWPAARRPGPALAQRLRRAGALGAVVAAGILAMSVPLPQASVPSSAPLATGGTASVLIDRDSAVLDVEGTLVALAPTGETAQDGTKTWASTTGTGAQPTTLTFSELVELNGGRIPSGLSQSGATGPFEVTWLGSSTVQATTVGDGLVDAKQITDLSVEYSGPGLTTPRVISIAGWSVDADHAAAMAQAVAQAESDRLELIFWKAWVPVFLLIVAAWLILRTIQGRPSRPQQTSARPSPAEAVKGSLHVRN
ncbi:hypothetical protein BH09ACT11_BH09ACT11_01160 [soil metagenome]